VQFRAFAGAREVGDERMGTKSKIDRDYRHERLAITREKSPIEAFDSGTQLAHKAVLENEFLRCFELLSLIGKSKPARIQSQLGGSRVTRWGEFLRKRNLSNFPMTLLG
jgi:hypothetical protein